MHFTLTGGILVVLMGYILIVLAIAFPTYHHSRSFNTFALGTRPFGGLLSGAAACVSDMGGFLFLALPGTIFAYGLWGVPIILGIVLGLCLFWRLLPARLLAPELGKEVNSIPDYLARASGDTTPIVKIAFSVAQAIALTLYLCAGYAALSVIASIVFSTSYQVGLIIAMALIMLMAFLGGFQTHRRVNLVSLSFILIALVLLPIVLFVTHGQAAFSGEAVRPLMDIAPADMAQSIFSVFGWALGYLGLSPLMLHVMGTRSPKGLKGMRRTSIIVSTVLLLLSCAIGFMGRALLYPQLNAANAEIAYPVLATMDGTPIFIAGILICGAIAAVFSSGVTHLSTLSASFSWDIYLTLRENASDRELTWVARITTVIVAIIAYFLAGDQTQGIMQRVIVAWSALGATLGPAVALCAFYKKTNSTGLVAALAAGALSILILNMLPPLADWGIAVLVAAFAIAMVFGVVFSHMAPLKRRFAPESVAAPAAIVTVEEEAQEIEEPDEADNSVEDSEEAQEELPQESSQENIAQAIPQQEQETIQEEPSS